MEILKAKISGRNAFFRNPEINDGDITFTYGHMHKVALLGILGAILGLKGHNTAFVEKGKKYGYPEFYEVLKDIKVAIVPDTTFGSFRRKKFDMINNCGYSKNKDTNQGQPLMYTEQWLEDVSWTVYIKLDTLDKEIADKLKDYILNNKAVYMPYLGKTNHFAVIEDAEILEATCIKDKEDIVINSLFKVDENVESGNNFILEENFNTDDAFEYREILPTSYSDGKCYYKTDMYAFSNKKFSFKNTEVIAINDLNLIFS